MEGPVPNDLLLLGEAPGYHEDLEGLPFRPHAPAGRVLHRALDELGLAPAIDNVVHCRPPDNKLKAYPDAIDTCTSLYLSVILSVVQPKVIVTLGALAGQTWFPGMKAMEMQQTARTVVIADERYIIVGCLHPAYVARGTDPGAYGLMMASLRRAAQLVKEV
jgi:DNA polymerase